MIWLWTPLVSVFGTFVVGLVLWRVQRDFAKHDDRHTDLEQKVGSLVGDINSLAEAQSLADLRTATMQKQNEVDHAAVKNAVRTVETKVDKLDRDLSDIRTQQAVFEAQWALERSYLSDPESRPS